jgi:RNA polymerase sigma-70 factor (ECF subfamily)
MSGGDEGLDAAGSTYGAFCERNRTAVLALAWALSGDRSNAMGIVDDAFAEAGRSWRKIGRYEDPDAWVRWVVASRAVARFRWRSTGRRAGAGPNVGRSRPGEAPALDSADDRFWQQVRSLPARQARCVALAYLEDLRPSEVARVIGCTVSTARHHLHLGRLALAGRRWPHQGQAADEVTVLARVDEQGRRAVASLRAAVAGAIAAPILVGSVTTRLAS